VVFVHVWRQSTRCLRAREQAATHLKCTPGRCFGQGAPADGVVRREGGMGDVVQNPKP